MADTLSPNYLLVEPQVGASADSWGSKLNADIAALDAIISAIATTGSANAYVLTSGQSLTSYVAQSFIIKANFTNTGAATINVDGLGAKALTKNGTTALVSGDIVSGTVYRVAYDGTEFQIVGSVGAGFQPLDATLTALAALTTSASQYIRATGTDTFTMDSFASVLSNLGGATDSLVVHLAGTETITGAKTFSNSTRLGFAKFSVGNNPYIASGGDDTLIMRGGSAGFKWDNNADTIVIMTLSDAGALALLSRPTFNGNTALDTNNGLQLGAANTITGFRLTLNDLGGTTNASGNMALKLDRSTTAKAQGVAFTSGAVADGGIFRPVGTDDISIGFDAGVGYTDRLRVFQAGDATITNVTPTSGKSLGYRGLGDTAAKTAAYTFVAADAGLGIDHNSASAHSFTLNTGILGGAGARKDFIGGANIAAGVLTIARGAGVTFRDASGTNADLTVNQYQQYSIRATDTSETFFVRVF